MPRKNKINGVYVILSTIDSRMYVGSSVDIVSRWARHKKALRAGRHHSCHLQRFVNKHGIDKLAFCVVRDCDQGIDPRKAEQFVIDSLNPEFNVNKRATSCLGVKRSDECKEKNRRAQIKRDLRGKRNPMYGTVGAKSPNWGKRHKPETIAKMVANHAPCKGKDNPKYGIAQDPEATKKANATKRARRIERYGFTQVWRDGVVVFSGSSCAECAAFIGVNPTNARKAKAKNRPVKGCIIT